MRICHLVMFSFPSATDSSDKEQYARQKMGKKKRVSTAPGMIAKQGRVSVANHMSLGQLRSFAFIGGQGHCQLRKTNDN